MLTTLLQSIGRTPLLRLSRLAAGLPGMLLLKLENQNPGGSIKDRAAFHILDRAMQRGELAPGGTVVEATSGNMGIGLAMTCAVRGLHCVLAMPESMSIERRQLLASLGAELILTPADKGMGGVQLFSGDRSDEIMKPYKITGIPRFMLFGKDGRVVDADAPRPSSGEIKALLDATLKK